MTIDYSNVELKCSSTEVANRLKDYVGNNSIQYIKLKDSEDSKQKITKYDNSGEIVSAIIAIIPSIITFILARLIDGATFEGRLSIAAIIGLITFGLSILLYKTIIRSLFIDKCLKADKIQISKDINELGAKYSLYDFIDKWFYLNSKKWIAHDKEFKISQTMESYVTQEKIREIDKNYSIIKVEAEDNWQFTVYYALTDGTLQKERFEYHLMYQNINAKEPSIKINNEAITLITPVSC